MVVFDQQRAALKLANKQRSRAALVKRNIASLSKPEGLATVAELLERPSGAVPSMRIGQLVVSVHAIGYVKADRLLRTAGAVSSDLAVRNLTRQQRQTLAYLLRREISHRPGEPSIDMEV